MDKIRLLKGGSLNETWIIDVDDYLRVRKYVDRYENREYGYNRWYSQLKRQQRYSELFPDLWLPIIDVGIEDNKAYFDMPYVHDSHNVYEYLTEQTLTPEELDDLNDTIWSAFDRMHIDNFMLSNPSVAELYVWQEVRKSLDDCTRSEFRKFAENKKVWVDDQEVPSFVHVIDEYEELFKKTYTRTFEVFSHGNSTLENMLYVPEKKQIIFIDPYEENVIDSDLADFSQVLQSCEGTYELMNGADCEIIDNRANTFFDWYGAYKLYSFHIRFDEELKRRLSDNEYIVTKLFHISQFIRMLPFKQHIDMDKMKLFYAWASVLFNDLRTEL